MDTPDIIEEKVEDMIEAALDILHESIQHTPIKIEETNGTDYDRGYIFYQDMVVRDVLDNTPKLKELLTTIHQQGVLSERERIATEAEKYANQAEQKVIDISTLVYALRNDTFNRFTP